MRRLLALFVLLILIPGAGSAEKAIRYRSIALPTATLHVVEVPPSFRVTPVLAPTRRTVSACARELGAVAALNGGYFNHQDGVSASYITIAGQTRSDPHRNGLLVNNPQLKPYLPKIFDRTEFRVLAGPDGPRWTLAPHFAPVPSGFRLVDALQAGPRLLPTLRLEEEGFVAYGPADAEGRRPLRRDGIAAFQRAARSALGLKPDRTLVLAAALGPEGGGLTLPELSEVLAEVGCSEAMNLDGGSSTTLVHREGDRLKLNAPPEGEAKVRSVLVVLPGGR